MNLQPLSKANYIRPEGGTYQDSIQNKKDMLEKLNDYERIDSIEDVPLKTHVRYVTLSKDTPRKQVFRLGGILEAIHSKYIQLSNGTYKWSVQRYHYNDEDEDPIFETKFWKVLTKEELMRKKILEQQQEIERLKKQKNK
jgi:hypothetical protein